ncbi:hypothetical protein ABVT39_026370 [Epinephelus coioides]
MGAIIRAALAHLQLNAGQGQAPSAFHRRNPPSAKITVPHSLDFLKELHSCWRDTSALTRPGSDEWALAAMEDAESVGLLHMPAVEPPIAALIVALDEAMKSDPKCPSAQCKVTDDYVCKAYNTAARVSRLGNTLSHLLHALSASLQEAQVDDSVCDICDVSLQAFAYQTRELGRLMSRLAHTRHHVWLAQSPLTEATRRVLRQVPAEPGELFGSAALEALDRTAEADDTRQRLASLHKRAPVSRSSSRTFPSAPQGPPRPSPRGGQHQRRDERKSAGGGSPAKQLSQVAETVFSVLGKSNTSITGLKEGIDSSLIQLVELCQSSEPTEEPGPSTSWAHIQPEMAPAPAPSPTPSLLEKKLEAEMDVLRQHKKVLLLQEEYYRLKLSISKINWLINRNYVFCVFTLTRFECLHMLVQHSHHYTDWKLPKVQLCKLSSVRIPSQSEIPLLLRMNIFIIRVITAVLAILRRFWDLSGLTDIVEYCAGYYYFIDLSWRQPSLLHAICGTSVSAVQYPAQPLPMFSYGPYAHTKNSTVSLKTAENCN